MHFKEALKIAPPALEVKDIAEKGVADAYGAFRVNVRRVLRLMELPGLCGWFAYKWGEFGEEIVKDLFGDSITQEKVNARMNEISCRIAWKIGESLEAWSPKDQRLSDHCVHSLDMTSMVPPNAIHHKNDRILFPLTALLESAIVQGWSAYEALCKKIWEAAVNGSKSLVAPTHFGTGKHKKPVGFASRIRTRGSYLELFKFDNAAIDGALSGDEIAAPSIVRNVLVHSGGFIDPDFMSDSSTVASLASLRALGLGAKITVDGALAKQLIDPLIPKGCALAAAVDGWLKAHS